ncbi:exodeoxyribonuclease VII large subunit [Parvularcula lutaonensis]|uniref:Exodeoxyribonuclease 7 large subunit n=1 Tax=Parvularcula lutaonensis TaxID=491923 RepID=A0ABV7M7X5_9PROT|nr:exodeoxyribonuclease VII large subunit [Parvularcula lutaonensis]GGY42785.1 exodeoxyribonuclease 7 large subunit [Parvularcula lutaonensis]
MSDGNVPEFTVTELAGKLKRTIEDAYGYVRVRGELGRVTRAGSGHVYLDLKDDRAVLSSVMWKGTAQRQTVKPEQGMEVVATGRMSTFPGQSRYQLIIDTLAPAGAGALMALYEERKKKLAAEGLFDPARKRPLPMLPARIGVVTSPSGAVIRDILHRLRDRFPSHVMVWPTLVQGEGAPAGIVRGIEGFGRMPEGQRPDVVIVARGGGSLEDLWCFNDEAVVRAAAASPIPLISAVGHETDTTLIDYAADVRAPTPTAAAEIAVPVRSELMAKVSQCEGRLRRQMGALLEGARMALRSAERGLGSPESLLSTAEQRLDRADSRFLSLRQGLLQGRELALGRCLPRLQPSLLLRPVEKMEYRLGRASLPRGLMLSRLERREERVAQAGRLLDSVSYKGVLDRGFALVTDDEGRVVKTKKAAEAAPVLNLTFADGTARVGSGRPAPKPRKKTPPSGDQQSLL